jgi:hypothetical protein
MKNTQVRRRTGEGKLPPGCLRFWCGAVGSSITGNILRRISEGSFQLRRSTRTLPKCSVFPAFSFKFHSNFSLFSPTPYTTSIWNP